MISYRPVPLRRMQPVVIGEVDPVYPNQTNQPLGDPFANSLPNALKAKATGDSNNQGAINGDWDIWGDGLGGMGRWRCGTAGNRTDWPFLTGLPRFPAVLSCNAARSRPRQPRPIAAPFLHLVTAGDCGERLPMEHRFNRQQCHAEHLPHGAFATCE